MPAALPMRRAVIHLVGAVALAAATGATAAEVDAARQAELIHLLRHDCGSCHGMTLTGGLGAPLVPEAVAERSDDDLVRVILDGMPGTPMPPWRPLLAPDEVLWLVKAIRAGGTAR